jgi:hypothetical protein
MFDSLVFYDASLDISCEGQTDFEEEEVVSFLRHHITQSRALGRVVNVFLCIFVYFMTILLYRCWWWWWEVFFEAWTFLFN